MTPDPRDNGKEGELTSVLDVSMPANSNAIAATADTITETLGQLGVPEEKQLEIQLAVQEALANAVVHGCKNDSSKQVRCRVKRNAACAIVITITDPGPGFSPSYLPDPRNAQQLHEGHGRGVFLIRQLMDEVSFESGGNQITMWKY